MKMVELRRRLEEYMDDAEVRMVFQEDVNDPTLTEADLGAVVYLADENAVLIYEEGASK